MCVSEELLMVLNDHTTGGLASLFVELSIVCRVLNNLKSVFAGGCITLSFALSPGLLILSILCQYIDTFETLSHPMVISLIPSLLYQMDRLLVHHESILYTVHTASRLSLSNGVGGSLLFRKSYWPLICCPLLYYYYDYIIYDYTIYHIYMYSLTLHPLFTYICIYMY